MGGQEERTPKGPFGDSHLSLSYLVQIRRMTGQGDSNPFRVSIYVNQIMELSSEISFQV